MATNKASIIMNIPHLTAIAEKIVAADYKQYSWMNKEHHANYVQSELKELVAVKTALLSGHYYTGVVSVAKSGMSRIIKIAYIENNKLCGVSDSVYKMAGCDKNHRISGCGMDMLFHAQYNLFVTLCPEYKYQDMMQRYNSL